MKQTLNVYDWQVLRFLLRNGVASGRQLRLWPSRRTKDGSFLNELVGLKLIEVVDLEGTPKAKNSEPDTFRATYRLTPEGYEAAEHGDYECVGATYVEEKVGKAVKTRMKINPTAKPLEDRTDPVKLILDRLVKAGKLRFAGKSYVVT